MNTVEVLQQIRNEPLKPVYLITGTEIVWFRKFGKLLWIEWKRWFRRIKFMSLDKEENGLVVIDEAGNLAFLVIIDWFLLRNPTS